MILDRGVGSYGGPLYNVYRIRPQQTNRYARLHNDYASWNRMHHDASFIGLAEGPWMPSKLFSACSRVTLAA